MALGYCPSLLIGIEEVAKNNDPQFKLDPIGFTEALQQPENASASVKGYDVGNGHQVDVRVKYLQRSTESDVKTTADCNFGTHKPYKETTVSISDYVEIDIALAEEEVRLYCSQASDLKKFGMTTLMYDHVLRVMSSLNGVRSKMNRNLVSTMANNFDPHPGSSSSAKDVTMLGKTATGATALQAPIWDGWNDIMQDYETAGLSGKPLVIGFGNFNRWNRTLGYACCNDAGVDASRLPSEYSYFRDLVAPSEWGANNIAVLAPGVVQLITYNKYRGTFVTEGNKFALERFTIPDPTVPNLLWDAKLEFDSCTEVYNLKLSLTHGLFVLPNDSYAANDRLYYGGSITGAFRYNVLQGS
jgi:hypothetical protein